ncbi:MAG: histidine phosphatase family protein [Magnetospirillum sp.]|nr:histidine phosphatase family protein [Magnetospirillum sp.]
MRIVALLLLLLATPTLAEDASAWRILTQPGAVGLMRHAEAPGTRDPEGFRLEDCASQRQLDDAGRAQARAMGEAVRRHGIPVARVYSSQWCRCRETAELLGLGRVDLLPALNSLRWDQADPPAQLAETRRIISGASGQAVLMVTHQFNITELTGESAASGEIIVVRAAMNGSLTVLGRVSPP